MHGSLSQTDCAPSGARSGSSTDSAPTAADEPVREAPSPALSPIAATRGAPRKSTRTAAPPQQPVSSGTGDGLTVAPASLIITADFYHRATSCPQLARAGPTAPGPTAGNLLPSQVWGDGEPPRDEVSRAPRRGGGGQSARALRRGCLDPPGALPPSQPPPPPQPHRTHTPSRRLSVLGAHGAVRACSPAFHGSCRRATTGCLCGPLPSYSPSSCRTTAPISGASASWSSAQEWDSPA